jgi:hypothetical protein
MPTTKSAKAASVNTILKTYVDEILHSGTL